MSCVYLVCGIPGSGRSPRGKWHPTPVFLHGKCHGQEPGGLQSTGSQRVGHDCVTNTHTHIDIDCIETYSFYTVSFPILFRSTWIYTLPYLLMQWIISRQVKVTSLILLQTSRSFLTYLEKQAKIDEDNVTLLENLCQKIVPNLMEKLDKYKRER